MKQCSVLIVNPGETRPAEPLVLKRTGFAVREIRSWPDDEALVDVEVVVVHVAIEQAAMIAARLRARPRFGRRVLIACVATAVSVEQRRTAIASGFDDVITAGGEAELGARVLRVLRDRPEYPCALPSKEKKTSAA